MLIKLSVLIVIVLCLSDSFVNSQLVIWDNLLDLCYWPRPERRATRCEGSNDVKFERRVYRNTIPYYCVVINNKDGAYKSLVIEYDGEKEFRSQDNYYANEVPSDSVYEDSFNLQYQIVEMVIFPQNTKHPLQRIQQIKLDNNNLCDPTQSMDFDRVFRNQPNTNNARFLNSCFDIVSRAQRERNKCELLDEVIVEELKFNNEISYYCIVVDKNLRKNGFANESELIEVRLSSNNAATAFSPKANHRYPESTTNYFRYNFIRGNMRIGLFPKNFNDNIGQITSIKVNGIESCSNFVAKPLQECGQVQIKHQYLISFGLPTYPGEFPWHVGLFEYDRQTTRYFCGGSIIGRNTILTAAHCLDRDQGMIIEEKIRVQAGRHDLSISDPNTREFRVERYVVHKNWNKLARSNDIAVIKLQTFLVYSDYIQPICFSRNKQMFVDKVGSVVGWGIDERAELQEVLKRAPMQLISNNECRDSNHALFDTLVNESTFCGGYRNGTSACKGDSGGGLVFNFNDGWYIRGIVSLSTVVVDDRQQRRCDSVQFIVFTDVIEFYDWVEEQLHN